MNKIRFGILGSGFMGSTHAEAIRRLPNAELIAVWGGRRAPALAERYKMAFEPDLDGLLKRPDIDAIIVTTPHHLHVDETLKAFAQGKHVLVEKPLATTVADCDLMLAAAAKHGRTLGVGYQQRFRTNCAVAGPMIRDGAIGKVLAAQVSMPMYSGTIKAGGFGGDWSWWNDPESVGHLLNSGPHAVDMLRWFTGGDVVTISAFSRTLLPDLPVEDTTMALVEFSTGAICTLFSSRALPAKSFPGEDFRFRITGSTGLIDLDPFGDFHISDEKGWRLVSQQPTVGNEDANTAYGDVRMKAYCDQMSGFIDMIEGRTSDTGNGADGRAGVEACVSMLESSKSKQWIHLKGK